MTLFSPRRAYLATLLSGVTLLLFIQFGPQPGSRSPEVAARSGDSAESAKSGRASRSALTAFDTWRQRYQAASPDRRNALLQEGRSLSEARRQSFLALMKSSPATALEEALSLSEFADLPAELAPFFERPLNGIGSVDLRWRTTLATDGSLHCEHEHILHLDGKSWTVLGEHLNQPLPPQKDVPVSGIALGNLAVLAPSGVRNIPPHELPAASKLFASGNPDLVDPVTGGPASQESTALVGGRLYHFESSASIDHVARELVRAEEEAREADRYQIEPPLPWLAASGGTGGEGEAPVDATPFMDDLLDVLFIRVDFSDFPGAPVSQVDLETTLAAVKSNVEEFSYNAATINFTVTPTVYRMPSTGASYAVAGNNNGIQTDARALASADFTIANYDVIAVFFPNLSGVPGSLIDYGGLASIGGSNHWINGTNSTNVILHEFGHNYGLYHANYLDPLEEIGGRYDVAGSLEYGDIFDRMGDGLAPEGHFNHFAKNRLQWMPDSKVAEANGDGIFRIYRFDHVNALANPTLALRVPMGGDVFYWVGYRQLYTSSAYNLSTGAYIVGEGLSQNAESNLIDATPGSASPESEDRKDCGLEVGAPFVDSGVTFEATARGGTAPNEWIDVRVTFAAKVGFVDTSVEVDEQSGLVYLNLQRQFSSTGIASVEYTTSNGSATAGDDYYAASGTVTWADGESANKAIAIPLRPDAVAEGSESFTVTLSNPAGTNLDFAATTATVTLLDPGQHCTSFDPDFFNNAVYAMAFLPDRKILIGGSINYSSGDFAVINDLARLNPDGSVDNSFATGTGFNGTVRAIEVQTDGRILVGGDFTTYNGTPCNHLIRLNSDGSIDTNIAKVDNGTVHDLLVEPDGKILVAGSFSSFDSTPVEGLIRLNADGTRDTVTPLALPFQTNLNTSIYALHLHDDGKIVAAGLLYVGGGGFRSGVARLNPDGTRDPSFDPLGGTHVAGAPNNLRPAYTLAALPDGKYLLGGWFTAYNTNPTSYLVRINADGSYDSSFTPPAFDDSVECLRVQPAGPILVGGRFTSGSPYLTRLNPNGTTDSSFVTGTGPSGPVFSLGQLENGMLYVGGNFFTWNGGPVRPPLIKVAGGASPYGFWTTANFTAAQIAAGDADPDADPDGDGFKNAAERVLGTPPTVATPDPVFGPNGAGTVEIVSSGGADYLQVTVEKQGSSEGVWFHAIFSSDLVTWLPNPALPGTNAIYDLIEDSPTRFVVRDKTPFTASRYLKIGITNPN